MLVARAALALLLAAPFFLIHNVAPVTGEQRYAVHVTISAPAAGEAQLFYNDGVGFSEPHSSKVDLRPGRRSYRFWLPPGTYYQLRLDPGLTGGRYVLERLAITDPRGDKRLTLSFDWLAAFHQVSVIARSPTLLVLASPEGSLDPFIVLQPNTPIKLPRISFTLRGLAVRLLLWWSIAFVVVAGAELAIRPLWVRAVAQVQRHWFICAARPRLAILFASAIATALATYPVLFAHRSLVSPANGPTAMLYDHAPFVPGSDDFETEDTRGSDVGAMMWAFVPYSRVQRAALAEGEWPLWMRPNGSGRPLWGQGQTFLLDPLHWLVLLPNDLAVGWDLKFIAHRLVFAVGIGIASLEATGSVPASLLTAAVAPFAGSYVYRLNHPAAFALTYAPWILVGWFRLTGARAWKVRWRATFLLTTASSLLLLASPPKEAAIMLVGMHLTGAISLWLAPTQAMVRFRGFVVASFAGVITAVLTLPHWLVFLRTLADSRTTYDTATINFATTESLYAFVLGNLTPGILQPGIHAIALAFAMASLSAPGYLWRQRRLAACALASTVLLALAFGAVPASWFLRVPLVRNISHFGDIVMSVLVIPMLLLCAGGLHAAKTFGGRATVLSCTVLAVAALFLLASTGGAAGFHEFGQWLRLLVLALSSVAVYVWSVARRDLEKAAVPAVCVVLTFIAVAGLGGLHLETGIPPLDYLLAQPRARVSLEENSRATDTVLHSFEEPTRAVGLETVLFQGSQALYELEGIGGPDALELGAYEDLLDAGGLERRWGWLTLLPVVPDATQRTLLDLLNVGILVARRGQFPNGTSSGATDGDVWIDVATRPTAWPRAYFVDGVMRYATPAGLMRLAAENGHPIAAVQTSDYDAMRLTAHLPIRPGMSVPAKDYALTTNTTSFTIVAPSRGIVVLTESWIPGDFRATINGAATPYFRVNHAFKGIVVPSSGTWRLRFEYRPAVWTSAWAGACIGFLMLIAVGVAGVGELRFSR